MMYEGFGKNVCEINGVGPDQAAAVRGDFKNMLEALSIHFADNDFLLGARPCLADFALAGASKAHFVCDPEPESWLGAHRDMLHRYTDRFFGDWQEALAPWPANDRVPDTTRARTQKRLNLSRLHVQDELIRVGAPENPDVQALFAGRGILEHYL
jgi:glutathione S-transferase